MEHQQSLNLCKFYLRIWCETFVELRQLEEQRQEDLSELELDETFRKEEAIVLKRGNACHRIHWALHRYRKIEGLLNDHRLAKVTDEDQTFVKTGHFLDRHRRTKRGTIVAASDTPSEASKHAKPKLPQPTQNSTPEAEQLHYLMDQTMKSNITVTTSESNPEAATPLGHSMYQQLSQKEKAAKQKAREAEKRRLKDLEDKLEAEDEALRERARHKIRSLGLRFKSRYQMDDVIEYAMYLGFDLDDYEDIELLWISDEGLVVDDPPNWVPKLTKDEEKYYENTVTGQVMWHHPHDYTYQQKFLDYKKNGGPIPAWWTEKRKTQDMEFQSHDGKIKLKKRRSSVTGGNVLEKLEEEPEE